MLYCRFFEKNFGFGAKIHSNKFNANLHTDPRPARAQRKGGHLVRDFRHHKRGQEGSRLANRHLQERNQQVFFAKSR